MKNSKRAKLKPCPFDGGKAELNPDGELRHMPHSVSCNPCHASTTHYRIAGLAVMAWNKRVKS